MDDLLKQFSRQPGQHFDCIIGVSGGKDSTRQALFVRDRLGLNPLLVSLSYPPQQITECGASNISNLINLGFDVVLSATAPETWRLLVQESFKKFTNYGRSTELALYASVPQLAIRYNIPLIFWGENPGLQLGDLKTLGRTGYDGNNLRYMNTLSGGGMDWMLESGFNYRDLLPYMYPTTEEFDAAKIQVVYLGWFMGDWSFETNAAYSCAKGLEIREDVVQNTGDPLGAEDLDDDWGSMNQMIKYYKFGFGRSTDYANEEIRLGRMSRNEGIQLVEQYDDACSDQYIESFCSYLDISVSQFWAQVHASLNKNLFTLERDGTIRRKFKVGVGL